MFKKFTAKEARKIDGKGRTKMSERYLLTAAQAKSRADEVGGAVELFNAIHTKIAHESRLGNYEATFVLREGDTQTNITIAAKRLKELGFKVVWIPRCPSIYVSWKDA